MKKTLAALMVLCLMFSTMALAETPAFTLRNGITFGMDMDQVMSAEPSGRYEIDREATRIGIDFYELEYEHVMENNVPVDLKYLFADNALVAVCMNYETWDISYAQLTEELTAKYGASVAVDMKTLGKGIYAVDDDGHVKRHSEAWNCGNVMIVLENDGEDLEVTYVDLGAAYLQ